MNIVSWNCQGSGGTTIATLSRYLYCTKADIAFISETRCEMGKAELRIKQLPLCNFKIVPSDGQSGGLWLIWGDEVKLGIIEASKNWIAAVVEQLGADPWLLIGVYRDPNRVSNPQIWLQLERIMEEQENEVCLIGDFNALTSVQEKWGDREDLSPKNIAFRTWINEVGLIDPGHCGPAYTWNNHQQGSTNVAQRLDRGLASLSWTLHFPVALVYHLPKFKSDHSPILISRRPKPVKEKRKFRSENWWLLEEGFHQVCLAAAQTGNRD